MTTKQSQVGGSESINLQAGSMTVSVGIDERRAREIYQEMSLQLRKEYSQEALKIATERVEQFENRLLPKMEEVSGALGAFSDPGFQILLVEAQKTAASTERAADYDLLSELLIHRFQKGDNRVVRAGISRAVEIVDEIADDALQGLTVAHAVSTFRPTSGDIIQGLNVLDDLYGKIIYGQLPDGRDWLDHLDILDAVRINLLGGMKKVRQFYPEMLSGYVDVGIKKNTSEYDVAMSLLERGNLPRGMLVDHIFNDEFVRVNTPSRAAIRSLRTEQRFFYNGDLVVQPIIFSEEQFGCMESIYDLYGQDSNLRNNNIEILISELNSRFNLRILAEWWDSILLSFQITSVGKILAHSNAQRCDKSLPPLN